MRRWSRALAIALFALVFCGLAADGQAKSIPRFLRAATRPLSFSLGMGPSLHMTGDAPTAFKLSQEFLGHFMGKHEGPALGVITQQDFSSRWVGRFGFTIAPKFVYDIPVYRPVAVYVSPSVSLGYHVYTYDCAGCDPGHAVDLQFGAAAKLIMQNRWLVFFQPTNFNFIIGGSGYWGMRYEMMFGGGVIF